MHNNARAFRNAAQRDGFSNASATASDDNDFILKPHRDDRWFQKVREAFSQLWAAAAAAAAAAVGSDFVGGLISNMTLFFGFNFCEIL